jgi:hypothetical protein
VLQGTSTPPVARFIVLGVDGLVGTTVIGPGPATPVLVVVRTWPAVLEVVVPVIVFASENVSVP